MQTTFAVELVFVLVLLVGSGETLKCYVCRSDVDEWCKGTMNESMAQECPARGGKEQFCRKISQKLRFKQEQSWTSIRECAYEKSQKNCYVFKYLELAYQETCECSEDNCNRGRSREPSVLTVAATSVSAWMFNYLTTDHT